MVWIFVALGGYFLNALAAIADKYILASKMLRPVTYAFFVSLLSLVGLAVVPFGVTVMDTQQMVLALLSGLLTVYALLAFYAAVQSSEISRVAPLVGSFTALITLVFSLVSDTLNNGAWNWLSFMAFWLLLAGSLLLAFESLRERIRISSTLMIFSLAAGVLTALSMVCLKHVFASDTFINGFAWSRLGSFLGGLSLLVIPAFRKEIESHCCHFSPRKGKRNLRSVGIFLGNKTLAALGALLLSYAIFLGPLVLVQALVGVQFGFVFLLAMFLSWRYPSIYHEKTHERHWIQKLAGIVLIGIGAFFAAFHG